MPPVTPTPTSVAGKVLPFQTIARSTASCETYDTEVIHFFVTTPEEFTQLLAQLPAPGDSRILEALPAIDFTSHAVVAVVRTCQLSANDSLLQLLPELSSSISVGDSRKVFPIRSDS